MAVPVSAQHGRSPRRWPIGCARSAPWQSAQRGLRLAVGQSFAHVLGVGAGGVQHGMGVRKVIGLSVAIAGQ